MKKTDTERLKKIVSLWDALSSEIERRGITREMLLTEQFSQWAVTTPVYNIGEQVYPAGWLEHSYVACCGTSVQPVLERLRQNQKLNMVYLCLDNDEAGEDACENMMEVLENMDVDVERLRPQGKDWNDDLRAKRGGHG